MTGPHARKSGPQAVPPKRTLSRRLRRYFFTGLIVVTPVGLTIGVLGWAFQILDGILGEPIQEAVGFPLPGVGFLLLALTVLLIGWIVRQAAGRQLLHWWNQALVRFPLTGRLYNAASQIVQSVVGEQKRIFRRPVLIPYPTEGLWAVAFVTSASPRMFNELLGEKCVNVFVPTTPNPTSGFMLIVPELKTKPLDVSVEDAMKLVISAGTVAPQSGLAQPGRRGLDLDHLLRDTSEFTRE